MRVRLNTQNMLAPPPSFAEITSPPRLARKRSAPISREWPPPCETGKCPSVNKCSCHKRMRPAALDYYECAALIYGTDAPGMPATEPRVMDIESEEEVVEVEVDCELAAIGDDLLDTSQLLNILDAKGPPFEETFCILTNRAPAFTSELPRRGPGRPPKWSSEDTDTLHMAINEYGFDAWDDVAKIVGHNGAECRRQWLLLEQQRHRTTMPDYFVSKRKKVKGPPRPACLIPDSCCSMEQALVLFMPDMQKDQPESPRSVDDIDLTCHEDPDIVVWGKKKVHWYGLPDNPPEWKTGERQKVARSWEPCRYVNTTPEKRDAKSFFLPTLSYEMCTTTLPPPSFWV